MIIPTCMSGRGFSDDLPCIDPLQGRAIYKFTRLVYTSHNGLQALKFINTKKMGYAETFLPVVLFIIIFLFLRSKSRLPGTKPEKRTLLELLVNLHRFRDWMIEVLEKSHCTFLVNGPWFSNFNLFVTIDPANIRYILSKNFVNFPKGPKFKQIFDILGDGIFNADSDMWKFQRKVAHSFLTDPRFNRFLNNTVHHKVDRGLIPILENAYKQGSIIDLQDLFQRFTFDTICILLTGQDPGSLGVDFAFTPISKALADVEEAIFYRHIVPESLWRLQRWLGIGMEKKMKEAWEALDHFTYQSITSKRTELKKKRPSVDNSKMGEEEAFDLLTLYMADYEGTHGVESSDKFLRDMILNLSIAGRDTTSVALSWFFWLLSEHPQEQTKIREELHGISNQENGDGNKLDFEDIPKLPYLHGAVSETLRLYPPVPFNHKSPVQPDVLPSGHEVNPSVEIIFDLFAMGRMKSIWGDDCSEFKPNRWISERGNVKHEPSYKFLAFSAGPRTCVGKEMALMQIKAVASAIISKYHFQVVEGHPVVPDLSVVLQMKHGLKVKVLKQWD